MQRNPFLRGFGQSGGAAAMPAAVVPTGQPIPPNMPPQGWPQQGYGSGQPEEYGSVLEGILDPQQDGSDYFFYVTSVLALAPAGTGTSQITIDAGMDFLWVASTYHADIAGAAVTISTLDVPNVTMLIQDTGATKNLMNAPVPVNMIAGTGEFPYRLIEPRLFRANSTINFAWTSYEAAVTYAHIYFAFHGIRKIKGTFG